MRRLQYDKIIEDLKLKMVFLSGPRQVGKTWLAKEIGGRFANSVYLNYDRREDREIIERESWLDETELLIFDELHKMAGWKNYIKGVFDTKPDHLMILVTGSARLETFTHSGDSLAGRFFLHRLFPFSPSELASVGGGDLSRRLLSRGGFPEPLLAENDDHATRWRSQYADALVREDLLDFERIHDLKSIYLVLDLLRDRVGSPLSYTSIAEDVGISPNTVKKYISIFEALYIVFRVTPFSRNIARSILKEPKIYFFDTGMVRGDEGCRIENLVALSLLRYASGMGDYRGEDHGLHYLRTKDGREVDFCLTLDNKPRVMFEVKRSESSLSKNLVYFHKKYDIFGIQLVLELKRERKEQGLEIRDCMKYLSSLEF